MSGSRPLAFRSFAENRHRIGIAAAVQQHQSQGMESFPVVREEPAQPAGRCRSLGLPAQLELRLGQMQEQFRIIRRLTQRLQGLLQSRFSVSRFIEQVSQPLQ